jgi:6-phosphogluconolactonase (cycloisomerase 2 family)
MKRFGKWSKSFSIRALFVLVVFAFAGRAWGQGKFAYVANQTDNTISAYTIDSTTGALTAVPGSPFGAAVLHAPTGLAADPAGKFLFVANECGSILCTISPTVSGNVSVFTIDSTTGALVEINGSPFFAGLSPVSLVVDPTGKFLYVVNLNGGPPLSAGVSAFSINSSTGVLTPLTVSSYATGQEPISVAMDPAGKFLYVVNAFDRNVSAYTINSTTGALSPVTGSPFSVQIAPRGVAVDSTGKFVYVTNSTSNTLSEFTIDSTTGALTSVAGSPIATGTTDPISVAMAPVGGFAFVTNFTSNNISGYSIDGTTGALTVVAGSPFASPAVPPAASTGGPTSVAVDPSGKFVYVTNTYHSNVTLINSTVSVYTLGASGGLTQISGSPFQAGLNGGSILIVGQAAAPPPPPPPPQQQITNLMNAITGSNIPLGTAISFNAHLFAAQTSLGANDTTSACNELSAFIHEVQAQSGKKITVADANQLIAQANAIKAALGCQ